MTQKKTHASEQDYEIFNQCAALTHALIDAFGGELDLGDGQKTTHRDIDELVRQVNSLKKKSGGKTTQKGGKNA